MTFQPTSLLLDKGIIRKILEGVDNRLRGKALKKEHLLALSILDLHGVQRASLYVTKETWHLIVAKHGEALAQLVLPKLRVLEKGKYFKRWARRLMEHTFTYEDAKILSSASFGVDIQAKSFGAEIVITFDRRMRDNFNLKKEAILARLRRMTSQLVHPYCTARLPEVLSPEEVLTCF